jgi:hypothetical protein
MSDANETTDDMESRGTFEATASQKAGARRTAVIIVAFVFAMVALATLSRVFGW